MAQQTGRTQLDLKFKQNKQEQPLTTSGLPWIEVAKDAPYFITEAGQDWTPVGQNDAITWPEFKGVFMRKDFTVLESYLVTLAQQGITCLRLMLEYCHGENRYFEKPAGRFQPNMVQLWDDIFALCEKHGLRILLTPYDTFWMWRRWSHHPYKKTNGGPCDKRNQWLLCPATRSAIKRRLEFASQRWGGSGALFAWDIWNEIHPAHAGDRVEELDAFVEDIGSFLRQTELRLHGRAHPQTVSVFGPMLDKEPYAEACTFRHPALDFASVHFYDSKTIDHPRNTIDPAITMGRLTAEALSRITDMRPFFDSEHGPIHAFKDKHKILPELFDDEYFRHMQWAHFASGGAGGGMRWPNRHPHSLTAGMRMAQGALARFLPLIDWQEFRRRNLNREILISDNAFAPFGCGDGQQALLWLIRTTTITKKGTVNKDAEPLSAQVQIPGLKPGRYNVTTWDTVAGMMKEAWEVDHVDAQYLTLAIPPITTDLALVVRRMNE